MTEQADQFAQFKKRLLYLLMALGTYSALLALVWFIGEESHLKSLKAFFIILPLFALQIIMLIKVALFGNYIVLYIRSRKWYDEHGPVNQLKSIQDRIGTKDEKPHDAVAMAIQFAGNSLLIAVMLLCFFLMRSGASVG